jgi:hypothetical protein
MTALVSLGKVISVSQWSSRSRVISSDFRAASSVRQHRDVNSFFAGRELCYEVGPKGAVMMRDVVTKM